MAARSIPYDVAVRLLSESGHVLTVTFVGTARGREFHVVGEGGGAVSEAVGARLLAHPKCHPVDRGLFPGAPEQTFSFHQNSNRTRNPPPRFGT